MGNLVSSLRGHLEGEAATSSSTSQPSSADAPATTMHQTSSRLNLINQLMGTRGGKRTTPGLGDFSNVSFASHFYIAGRRFKNIVNQAQTFLFGDQLDLGFLLAHKPILVQL